MDFIFQILLYFTLVFCFPSKLQEKLILQTKTQNLENFELCKVDRKIREQRNFISVRTQSYNSVHNKFKYLFIRFHIKISGFQGDNSIVTYRNLFIPNIFCNVSFTKAYENIRHFYFTVSNQGNLLRQRRKETVECWFQKRSFLKEDLYC